MTTEQRVTLYLLVGYPGSGKTTVSKVLDELTDAEHIWADKERRDMFGTPTYTPAETRRLYAHLNDRAKQLLQAGTSVIFDTNFNFRGDREALRHVATSVGADTKLLWVVVDKAIAQARATSQAELQHTRVLGNMTIETFERITANLEPPTVDEFPITLDGTKITNRYVAEKIGLISINHKLT